MENKLFLIFLIVFALIDLYKLIKNKINYFSLLRPLSLAICYKFIFDGIDERLNVIALAYFIFFSYMWTRDIRKEEIYEKEIWFLWFFGTITWSILLYGLLFFNDWAFFYRSI